jgi:hypothetical protein
MKDLNYWLKEIDQFAIPIAIFLELDCFVLKHVEEVVGRAAVLKVLGGGMCSEIYSCFFGIVT